MPYKMKCFILANHFNSFIHIRFANIVLLR